MDGQISSHAFNFNLRRYVELPLRALAACVAWTFGVRKDMRAAFGRPSGVVEALYDAAMDAVHRETEAPSPNSVEEEEEEVSGVGGGGGGGKGEGGGGGGVAEGVADGAEGMEGLGGAKGTVGAGGAGGSGGTPARRAALRYQMSSAFGAAEGSWAGAYTRPLFRLKVGMFCVTRWLHDFPQACLTGDTGRCDQSGLR